VYVLLQDHLSLFLVSGLQSTIYRCDMCMYCLRYFTEYFSFTVTTFLVCTYCNHNGKLYFCVHIEKYDLTSGDFLQTCMNERKSKATELKATWFYRGKINGMILFSFQFLSFWLLLCAFCNTLAIGFGCACLVRY
jgi:hypothetical protein